MKPENVFQLEIANALSGKLSLSLRFGFTWLVALALTILPVSPAVSIPGLMMLFLFTTFFGAVIATARRRSEGRFSRLRLLPLSLAGIGGDYLLAGALAALVRMTPVLVLFALVRGEKIFPGLLVHLVGLLVVAVFVLYGAGTLIGLVTKSNQEAHLFGALAAALIAFVSDVIPVHAGLRSFMQPWTSWNPLSMLGSGLEKALQGTGSGEVGQVILWGLVLGAASAVFIWRALSGKLAENPPLAPLYQRGVGGIWKNAGRAEDPGNGATAPRE